MQVPLKVTFEGGLEPNPALEARIEREARKLEQFGERITACHVALIGRSRHRHKGDLYQVRIHISLPGRADVVVDRNPSADHAHEDPYVAVRDAFAAARRQLQDHERRFEGKVKAHEAPPLGRISQLFPEQDYGLIESADGQEFYFHRNAVVAGDFEGLSPGDEVRFAESEGGDKGPTASSVHKIGKSHIVAP
ncbi:MAG TPA: HPF/RaiA family ribosome-associated protein [Caulobacteraceae bacterium]|nr:HPF/RaiA family ribosome-associated protein [Caulobacteraceae bacterium]